MTTARFFGWRTALALPFPGTGLSRYWAVPRRIYPTGTRDHRCRRGTNVAIRSVYKPDRLDPVWFDAPDLTSQKHLADQMRLLGPREPSFIPFGQYFIPYAFRSGMSGFVGAPITALRNLRKG
jgi:hypothetical protein